MKLTEIFPGNFYDFVICKLVPQLQHKIENDVLVGVMGPISWRC